MTWLLWLALIVLPLGVVAAVFNAGYSVGYRMGQMRKDSE